MEKPGISRATRNWMKGRQKPAESGPRKEMVFSDIVGAPVGRCGRDQHRARWSCAYMRLRSKWSIYLRALQLRCRMARTGRVGPARKLRKLDTPLHHCIRTDRLSRLVQEYLEINPPRQKGVPKKSAKDQPCIHVSMTNPRLRSIMVRTIDHVRNRLAIKVGRIKPPKSGDAPGPGRRGRGPQKRKPPGPKESLPPRGPEQPPVPVRLLIPYTTKKEWWPFRKRVRVLRKNLILLIVLVTFVMTPILILRISGSVICFGRKADCYMPTCKEVKQWQWQLRNCGPTMLEIDCQERRLYYTPYDSYIYTNEPPVTKARHKYEKGINKTCPDKMKVLVPQGKGKAPKGGKDEP